MKYKRLKEKLSKFLENIYSLKLVSKNEKDIFESLITTANDKEVLTLLEAELYEKAEDNIGLADDINTIYELLKFIARTDIAVKSYIKDFLSKHPLKTMQYAGLDIFKIFKQRKHFPMPASTVAIRVATVYHAVIKFSYDNKLYSFGYNNAQKSLSFTVDNSKIKYSYITLESEDEEEARLKEAIAAVLDVNYMLN